MKRVILKDQFETVDEESYKQLSVENDQLREIVKVSCFQKLILPD